MNLQDLLKGDLTIQMKVAPDTKEAERILETMRDAFMKMAETADEALGKIKQPTETQEMLTHCPEHGVELTLEYDEATRIVKYCSICSKRFTFNK